MPPPIHPVIKLRPNNVGLGLFVWIGLAILIVYSMPQSSAAQTASSSANRRRAQLTQNYVAFTTNLPDPSGMGAVSASVDAAIDRRVNADRQNDLNDPSLSPLRVIAPNVNGEDDASVQTEIPIFSNGGRAKDSAFTVVPLSTSNWGPGRMGHSQNAPALRGQSPVTSVRKHRVSTHGSDEVGRTENISSNPIPISGAERDLRRTPVHRSNLNSLHNTRSARNGRSGSAGLQSLP
jgi:hypothetical protein